MRAKSKRRRTLSEKILARHVVDGSLSSGGELGLRIDQTLTQDATGTLVMLELEAMGLERARTDLSVQYVDHNLLEEDHRNADDHLFLRSACRRFGLWYSPAGNGVSHPVHQQRFGKPGATLLGSDSHTPAAGSLGMLAIGAGGLEVALAMAGYPYFLPAPKIWGVRLSGALPDWVSAKDVILEMLRRHGVAGGVGKIVEYHGPGLRGLTAMDRHVIANMGAELGATTTVFPSDGEVRRFLAAQGREEDWQELAADEGAAYDFEDEIDLGSLVPLIAMPSSPGNVRPVSEVAGREISQAYVGSSANPGYRDFAVAAEIVADRRVSDRVSFDVVPTSRELLETLAADGHLRSLIRAGARIHQAGCGGCIGMGQAPATGKLSLRTVPRNFPGRSGTKKDQVCLVSPETAAASALSGVITDPRTLDRPYPRPRAPEKAAVNEAMFVPPLSADEARKTPLEKGPGISTLPELEPLPDRLEAEILLKVGDNLSTDEILPAGARVLPFRSDIGKIAEFCFEPVDETYYSRARALKGPHAVAAGVNYGQGSSREHAALAPRTLGLRLVLAKSFARIHWRNLVAFGVLPLTPEDGGDIDRLKPGDRLLLRDLRAQIGSGSRVEIRVSGGGSIRARHELSARQVEAVLEGGLINWAKDHLLAGAGGFRRAGAS